MIIEDKRKSILQIIVSSVFMFFSVLQIIAVVSAYFEQKAAITNPLIPGGLLLGIRNFTIFVVMAYAVVLLANLFCIYKKKYFYSIQALSFVVLLCFQFFYPEIIDFFME